MRGTTSGSYRAFVENCFQLMPRQALHAKSIGFQHPRTKQWMQFDSELPEDFKAVLAKWEKYVNPSSENEAARAARSKE